MSCCVSLSCHGVVASVLYSSTCLTPGSVEPREAAAGVGAQTVKAAGSVHAGVRVALVHIYLTQPASKTLHTLTPGRAIKMFNSF